MFTLPRLRYVSVPVDNQNTRSHTASMDENCPQCRFKERELYLWLAVAFLLGAVSSGWLGQLLAAVLDG